MKASERTRFLHIQHVRHDPRCSLCVAKGPASGRNAAGRRQCPDCGAVGEIRGHMECQYPSNSD